MSNPIGHFNLYLPICFPSRCLAWCRHIVSDSEQKCQGWQVMFWIAQTTSKCVRTVAKSLMDNFPTQRHYEVTSFFVFEAQLRATQNELTGCPCQQFGILAVLVGRRPPCHRPRRRVHWVQENVCPYRHRERAISSLFEVQLQATIADVRGCPFQYFSVLGEQLS